MILARASSMPYSGSGKGTAVGGVGTLIASQTGTFRLNELYNTPKQCIQCIQKVTLRGKTNSKQSL
jgi:hypothetical protein